MQLVFYSIYISTLNVQVRERVGSEGQVIGAVSGGVDSSVAAILMTKAIGSRFHAFLVDNGCLRKGECEEVLTRLKSLGINIQLVDASDRFISKLSGVVSIIYVCLLCWFIVSILIIFLTFISPPPYISNLCDFYDHAYESYSITV